MITCIIPARSGSKRIKNKNLKNFFGKPLIYYSIKLALKNKLFKDVIVSTNSKKIARVATKLGARVPYLRSKKNSTDNTPIIKVLKEVVDKLKLKDDYLCCLYPTAPFLKEKDLKRGLKKIGSNYDQIIAISKFSSPTQRAFVKYRRSLIKFTNPKYRLTRSQDLAETFFDSGTYAIYKKRTIINYEKIKNLKIGFVELDRYSAVDINNDDDLNFAKFIFKFKNNK